MKSSHATSKQTLHDKKMQNSQTVSSLIINSLTQQNSQQEATLTERRLSVIDTTSSNIQKVKIPKRIEFIDRKIRQISLGTYHVIALTIDGQCYTWGNGIYGQLGNNKFGESSPELISLKHLPSDVKFIKCSAGDHHSCLLDLDGNPYTCGSNSYGVLGHTKHENQTKKKRCKIFEKVTFFEENHVKIETITSGDRHILVMSSDQRIYGWGSNKHQQVQFSSKDIENSKY